MFPTSSFGGATSGGFGQQPTTNPMGGAFGGAPGQPQQWNTNPAATGAFGMGSSGTTGFPGERRVQKKLETTLQRAQSIFVFFFFLSFSNGIPECDSIFERANKIHIIFVTSSSERAFLFSS
jgi:hypothetical protein